VLFSLVFWSWTNGSQYYDLHGNDGIRTRVFTFLQMLSIVSVAITIPSAFEGHTRGLALAFAFSQAIVTYLWWSVGYFDRSHRVFSKFFTIGFLIGLALIVASAFRGPKAALGLWIAAALVDISPPLVGWRTIVGVLRERGQTFSASASIVERFGLFTIIVLTESIVGTVAGVTEAKHLPFAAWLAVALALFLAFLLWSLYFDMTSEQDTKQGYAKLQALIFLHFPLLASLSMVGASIKILLASMESAVPADVPRMLCMSLAAIQFCIIGLAAIMEEEEEDRSYIRPVSRVLGWCGVALIGVALLGTGLGTLALLGVVSAILLVPVAIGIRSWVRYRFAVAKDPEPGLEAGAGSDAERRSDAEPESEPTGTGALREDRGGFGESSG
jgi:low temperature requirement protein LtrA